MTWVTKNIFTLTPKLNNHFDYIIEQTCFCAIDPENRKKYNNLVYRLLKPGGSIIGLWYPLDKKLSEGGPAFGVSEHEIKTLFNEVLDLYILNKISCISSLALIPFIIF